MIAVMYLQQPSARGGGAATVAGVGGTLLSHAAREGLHNLLEHIARGGCTHSQVPQPYASGPREQVASAARSAQQS